VTDYGQELHFGVFITPVADQPAQVLELAKLADLVGLDLVTFQDHPYQARFLDTWTLLSVIAGQTTNVKLAPNVANLPLRPPFMLARSVATLDILSGGRAELGLGSGAFWDAIAAAGGPRLTPGEGVDAVAEALEVIRATWDTSARSIRHDGEHYRVNGAHPGPAPVHDVEIWLGAYKKRMLALTGAKADGWLPSQAYAGPEALPAMNAAIDDAAEAAGRRPTEIRRLYNVNGSFGNGGGFLQGAPADWAEQLAELTLSTGISAYILSVASDGELRRFAEEVAPAVRALVESERGDREREPRAAAAAGRPAQRPAAMRFAVTPTPDDGIRVSAERPWDESTRPAGPQADPERRYTADQQAAGQHLIDIHDGLRAELERLRDLIDEVGKGTTNPAAVRSFFNRMTIRQNNWTLGTFCASYCRAVTGHHTLEDRSVFPHLRHRDERLEAVLDRLGEEHEVIAAILDRIDEALVALVGAEPDGMTKVRDAVDLLTDAMVSHLAYEERELVEPLARLGYY
jgi:alkanesulfonate monooxygenase SsuD/methylene tetrahydromethanopterin reductase-like flavin-dependent oxidoreductase (luciferase family)